MAKVDDLVAVGPTETKSKAKSSKGAIRQVIPQTLLEPIIAFYIFSIPNLLAALYAPIQDCDEVFNYWEPTHYLNHGFGFQTWEYSPDYAIRSWLYVSLHAIVGKIGSVLPFMTKKSEFFFVRVVLAIACAVCETRLFIAISRSLNPRVGVLFLLVLTVSPGMFHASAAYLPSSFSMYTTMLGMASFMDWRGGLKTNNGIFWFGAGGIVGWPFATILVFPFLLEEVTLGVLSGAGFELFQRLLDGTVRASLALVLEICVDSFFYKKILAVPWNIVMYNIFSGSGKGPSIYGTEPWHFYLRNLLLNFNVWFILAGAALPLLGLQYYFRRHATSMQSTLRSIVFTMPVYLWLGIFSLQPHKEERFMYPIYPAIGMNAAIASHMILSYIGSTNPKDLIAMVPPKIKFVFVSIFVLLAIDAGISRTFGMVTAYSAPLKIYDTLQESGVVRPGDTVCLGKEWYRFPSSYFIPKGVRAKFVKSAFNGLLPGEFNEAKVGFGFFPGTWLVPAGMNDENIEDPGKYTDISHCSFLVDSYFPGSNASQLEPHHVVDKEHWEEILCSRFLDASRTSLLGRTLWFPDSDLVPEQLRRKWGQYCLLRRRTGR
ncbi:MAG: mannosyltransferase [Pycnora praestabilis]|nr:MAG: mannosyltransferase [Pycnora praestabilis]